MLILTRRPHDSFVIDDGKHLVRVTVLQVRGNHVKVGVTAPRTLEVHRSEIYRLLHGNDLPQCDTEPNGNR